MHGIFCFILWKKLATDKEADDFVTYQSALVNRSTVCDTAAIPRQDAGYGYYAGLMTFNSLQKLQTYVTKYNN